MGHPATFTFVIQPERAKIGTTLVEALCELFAYWYSRCIPCFAADPVLIKITVVDTDLDGKGCYEYHSRYSNP